MKTTYYLIQVFGCTEPAISYKTEGIDDLIDKARDSYKGIQNGPIDVTSMEDALFGLEINEDGEPSIFAFTNHQMED